MIPIIMMSFAVHFAHLSLSPVFSPASAVAVVAAAIVAIVAAPGEESVAVVTAHDFVVVVLQEWRHRPLPHRLLRPSRTSLKRRISRRSSLQIPLHLLHQRQNVPPHCSRFSRK